MFSRQPHNQSDADSHGVNGTLAQDAISSTKFSKSVIHLMDDFRACGVPLDLDVPTIAIIGNQSSGKSSVIEAICGAPLPRASGTCTRCPTEIRLITSSDDWKCKIALRAETDTAGNRLEKIREEPFGEIITSPDDVADRLRRAQLAVLSPDQDPKAFLYGDLAKRTKEITQSFSTTTICLTISGKECINLSFIDLPGIITNVAEGESLGDVQLIEQLVRTTIAKQNTVILLTINASDDIQNQSGFKLAREADPHGKRTIGVLTKTDLIQEGDSERWLKMLMGHEKSFTTKSYAVRNPAPKELLDKISFQEARKLEKAFFAKEPWSTLPMAIRARLGISNLARELSEYLEKFIRKCLPNLGATLEDELEKTTSRLNAMPPRVAPEEAMLHLTNLCADFCKKLDGSVKDGIEEDEDGRDTVVRDIKRRALDHFKTKVGAGVPLAVSDIEFQELTAKDLEPYAVRYAKDKKHIHDVKLKQRQKFCYRLSEVRTMIEQKKGFELAGSVPYTAKTRMMKESLEHIPDLQAHYLRVVKRLFNERLTELIDMVFGHHTHGGLHEKVITIMKGIQGRCEARLTQYLSVMWENESHIPYTYDDQFDEVSIAYGSKTQSTKSPEPQSFKFGTQSAPAPASAKTPLPIYFDVDGYKEERQVWSEVAAYWKITSKQIVDVVVKAILRQYIDGVARETRASLATELDLYTTDSPARCAAYLMENEDTIEERKELIGRKDRLSKGLEALQIFEGQSAEH